MPCQRKTEPLEFLELTTVQSVLDSYDLLYSIGYRGTLSTIGDSARIDMALPDAIPVAIAVGDVILYKTSPVSAVVDCVTAEEFVTDYDILGT